MENSFDNAHFAFVHKGTFGQLDQPVPEKYQIEETDYGFGAETLITAANPPIHHRIVGPPGPATRWLPRGIAARGWVSGLNRGFASPISNFSGPARRRCPRAAFLRN